ncbi:MAG: hypothetical protein KAQ63_00885 [Candidatus Moranbacteria bacterium]|nr:hypothetical protein [Candidatus Moranbacteria bacterium]
MSPLNDLHRRLYSHDNEDLINREISPDSYKSDEKSLDGKSKEKPLDKKAEKSEESQESEEQSAKKENPVINQLETKSSENGNADMQKMNRIKKFKMAGSVLTAIFVIIGLVIVYVKYKQSAFSQENVVVEFQGDQDVKSGELFDYKLVIHNNNRVAINEAQIQIKYPEELVPTIMGYTQVNARGSFYIDVGKIKSRESKEYQLKFKAFASRENQVYLSTDFRYKPSNFSSVFNKEENHIINILGSIVDFSLVSQQEVSSGESSKMIAVLTNNTPNDISNLILKMSYPEGYSFGSSNLEKVAGIENSFKIPLLKANEKREVEILGSFAGEVDMIKKVIGEIGILSEESKFSSISLAEEIVKVIPSRIGVYQEIVSGVDADTQTTYLGTLLKYEINFKNNSSNPLLDLVLKEDIKTDLIDHSSVRVDLGFYDQEKQQIIWKASDVPVLKVLNPGESGSVAFDFMLKDSFVPKDGETNQTIATQAKISSLNVNTTLLANKELSSGDKLIKVNTNLDVLISGEFAGSVFKNNGPIPLRVGEETTFTIKVALKNNFNKIDKPSLTIKIPSGIIWKNSFHRSSGTVAFNERSHEIKWEPNALNSQVGYKYPAEELIFQIGVLPQSNQDGRDLVLVNSVEFQGFENFVEKNIVKKLKEFKLYQIRDYGF